jgi:PAP2 superfamily
MWPWRTAALCSGLLWVVGGLLWRTAPERSGSGLLSPTAPERSPIGWAGRARRVAHALGPYLVEAGTAIALYAVWQIALDFLVVNHVGAYARGVRLYHLERDLHLPSEVWVQHRLLAHPWLVRLANRYYADVDFPGLCLALFWLFWRHRDRFRHYRLTLIVATGLCSVLQAIPVAPPRLLPQFGFVDTALRYGQSVYGTSRTDPAVLTTMPSVHVLWATLIAVLVIRSSPSRWRWWILADPVLTVLVVVGTGNHFWADGIVADAILLGVLVAQRGVAGRRRRPDIRRRNVPFVTPCPENGRGDLAGSMLETTRQSRS